MSLAWRIPSWWSDAEDFVCVMGRVRLTMIPRPFSTTARRSGPAWSPSVELSPTMPGNALLVEVPPHRHVPTLLVGHSERGSKWRSGNVCQFTRRTRALRLHIGLADNSLGTAYRRQ